MIEEGFSGVFLIFLLRKSGSVKSSYDFFANVFVLTANSAPTSERVKSGTLLPATSLL